MFIKDWHPNKIIRLLSLHNFLTPVSRKLKYINIFYKGLFLVLGKEFIFQTLKQEFIEDNVFEIIKIGRDVPGEYWKKQHFLIDLPEKWKLSFVVIDDGGKPVAYAISSMKTAHQVHLHHFAVDSNCRGKGLGGFMIREVISRAEQSFATVLTLKVSSKNRRGQSFYENHGFVMREYDKDYIVYEKTLKI